MYNPIVGRWMEEDPIDFKAGDANLYRYVWNDPTNATDLTGLKAKKLDERKASTELGTFILLLYTLDVTDEGEFPKAAYPTLDRSKPLDGVWEKAEFHPSERSRTNATKFYLFQVARGTDENGKRVKDINGAPIIGQTADGWFVDNQKGSYFVYGMNDKKQIPSHFGQIGDAKQPAILIDRPNASRPPKKVACPRFMVQSL
jgi:uncharacterized protein RhaS with RHS repeats